MGVFHVDHVLEDIEGLFLLKLGEVGVLDGVLFLLRKGFATEPLKLSLEGIVFLEPLAAGRFQLR